MFVGDHIALVQQYKITKTNARVVELGTISIADRTR